MQTQTAAPVSEKTPADKTTSPAPTAVTNTITNTDSLVTASATVDRSTLRAGDTFTVRVEVQIESGWHIYAIDRPTGPSIPTSINFELPKTLAWDGDWTGSEPTLDDAHPDEPSFIYTGSASFSRRVRVAQGASSGAVTLRGNLRYQACDKFSCRAPTRQPLETQITIAP
jgi:DsbC/DsbD-like thiol-disulfide interchange protein